MHYEGKNHRVEIQTWNYTNLHSTAKLWYSRKQPTTTWQYFKPVSISILEIVIQLGIHNLKGFQKSCFCNYYCSFFLISAKYHKMHWTLWSRNLIFAFVCLRDWTVLNALIKKCLFYWPARLKIGFHNIWEIKGMLINQLRCVKDDTNYYFLQHCHWWDRKKLMKFMLSVS